MVSIIPVKVKSITNRMMQGETCFMPESIPSCQSECMPVTEGGFMLYDRMLNKEIRPSDNDILSFIDDKFSLWLDLHKFIESNYDFKRETKFYAKKYGWTVRYRKSGRTLVSTFPEEGAFSVLLVLGQKEVDKAYQSIDQLTPGVRDVLENTSQLHDGRWLWLRMLTNDDIESVKILLSAKRKPKPQF